MASELVKRYDTTGEAVSDEELARLRLQMVNSQIIARGVKDPLVLEAINRMPRHEFVPPGQERQAYADGPLMIGSGQTISQPYIVALMTELAKISRESKVLEIGTGSGYQTAMLAEIASHVFTVEVLPLLAGQAREKLERLGYSNISYRVGDGHHGWPEEAPFDSIVVTAAPETVPRALIDQLKEGGQLVIPIGSFSQDLQVLTKTQTGTHTETVIAVRFVPLIQRP